MSDKPIVLMLDEVDTLVGDTLVSLLRQLRTGYMQRPKVFPLSIILCGVRDVRDYRIQTSDKEIVLGGSAFNIKAASLRMGNFDQVEIRTLYNQHTVETGQVFAEQIGTDEIHLLVFNRDTSVSREDKIYHEARQQDGRSVSVWGC